VSTGAFSSGGDAVFRNPDGSTNTFTWTGSGDLLAVVPPTDPNRPVNMFDAYGASLSHAQMEMVFDAPDQLVQETINSSSESAVYFCPTQLRMTLNLDKNATIAGGSFSVAVDFCGGVGGPADSTVEWQSFPATPGTEPDPNSAR
jgi:hypothetical protein